MVGLKYTRYVVDATVSGAAHDARRGARRPAKVRPTPRYRRIHSVNYVLPPRPPHIYLLPPLTSTRAAAGRHPRRVNHRLGRLLRSTFVPAAPVVAFSCLLTFIFVLYQPTPGPGSIQKLGWQSWEVVSDSADSAASALETTQGSSGDNPAVGNVPPGVDWWNVSTGAETVDTASLPLDVWDPLMQHDTGCE